MINDFKAAINLALVILTKLAVFMFFILITSILLLGQITNNLESMDKLILMSLLVIMLLVQIKTKGWEKKYDEV